MCFVFKVLVTFICSVFFISADITTENSSLFLWQNVSNFMQFWSKDFSDKNKPIVEQLLTNSKNISKSCGKSLISTLDGVSNFDDWAIEMINSWGNFPPRGLFEGSLTDFGSYDQCLSVADNHIIGSAKYCSVKFAPVIPRPMPRQQNLYHRISNLLPPEVYRNKSNALIKIANESSIFYWVSLRTAVCIPSKCSEHDIQVLSKRKNSRGFIFVRLFSLRKTTNRLFAPTASNDLSCIHGIRVLSILWILYGHTIQWSDLQMYSKSFSTKELLTIFLSQPLLNGEYGVVTFLLISGILTTYISLSMTKNNLKDFNLSFYIILRITRLLPQLMIVILLTFLLPTMGSGPLWDEVVVQNVRKCENNWWLNLFLVQNLFRTDQMCALHTWFIALDFQFHLLTALLIIIFLYNNKFGVFANIFSILTFLVISLALVYVYELPPALINTGRTEYFEEYYSNTFHKKPVSYGAVYFTGTLLGYFLYGKKSQSMTQPMKTILWTAILIGFCVPLWDKVYWNYGRLYSPLVGTLIYNTNQMIWTVCTSAMIWLCITGNGKVIDKFLSHKAFTPLSRLTYCVYLCHAWLIWYFMGSRRHLMDVSMYNTGLNFLHICLMSYILGFIFYVLFESPILESQKCLLESIRRKHNKTQNNIVVDVKLNAKTFINNNNP